MAKGQRTSNSTITALSNELNSNASIMDALGDEQEATIADLKIQPIPNEQDASVGKVNTPDQFIPKEQALSFEQQVSAPVKRQAIIIKPISQSNFRLGLENTPEKYKAMPGTAQRWAPKRVGNLYRTGLNRPELAPTDEERKKRIAELEYHFGKKLNNDFYADMGYRIDSNKPLGEKLFLDKPEDLVVYLAMLESDSVANGMHEYKSGAKPFAIWYIEDKEAEAEADALERTNEIKAGNAFNELSQMKKRKISTVLGLEVLGLTDGAAESVLWKWIKTKVSDSKTTNVTGRNVSNVQLFMEILKRGDTYINVSELVANAIRFNILRKSGTGDIFYGDSLVGSTAEQIVEKLMSTQYSDLRLGIQSKVEVKLNTV